VKAVNEALVDLQRYVGHLMLLYGFVADVCLLQSSYMEVIFGVMVAGLVTGSSALHPKSSGGLHISGPTSEVTNMELHPKSVIRTHEFMGPYKIL
jgi:hypothetical protein